MNKSKAISSLATQLLLLSMLNTDQKYLPCSRWHGRNWTGVVTAISCNKKRRMAHHRCFRSDRYRE